MNNISSFFLFLFQQFITRSARADRGSYIITTYRQTEVTYGGEIERKRKEKKRKKENRKKKKTRLYMRQ